MRARLLLLALALLALPALVAGCGEDEQDAAARREARAAASFTETLAQARGQKVRWWMFGGDARVNRYVERVVVPAAAKLGVEVERVPVDDTASAVQRVLAERRAGKESGGAVDLIWLNGENFARGKQGGLWLEGWASRLPNARFLDEQDPLVRSDFGVPVDGQESPWSRAAFVFAHDRSRTPAPPRTFEELLAYARENPGRITYPAPPDFTGSAFVRQAVQSLGETRALELLAELKPLQFRGGETFPRSEAELSRLFGDGEVDVAMSYDPGFVANAVRRGEFPRSTRPYVFSAGTLQNMSFVTIPANAAHVAGAKVLANLLLEPRLQASKADPDVAGIPTALDLARLGARDRARFGRQDAGPFTLGRFGKRLDELSADRVPALERRWKREVLR